VRRLSVAHVTTMHGRLDMPELAPLFAEFHDVPLVSISDAQREPLPEAGWIETIHHGLPVDLLGFDPGPGKYLAFLGRIAREKRVDRAIAIATALGQRLRIAAKIDPTNQDYYEREIVPLLDDAGAGVEFVGEIGEAQKAEFLGHAYALLFPIDWPEPFGLVMIEAMACGTPVIAYRNGSVPEVLEDGVTGFVVNGMEAAIAAVERVPEISREQCRSVFEERFSARRMARDYVRVYERVAAQAASRMPRK